MTYHEPCHLAHGQRVREAPRAILRAIPGLRLVELAESDLCCGSAGVYNLMEPEIAGQLLVRKLDRIAATGAGVVASGNPGCLLQLRRGLADRGLRGPRLPSGRAPGLVGRGDRAGGRGLTCLSLFK